jgi:hypothetical protein
MAGTSFSSSVLSTRSSSRTPQWFAGDTSRGRVEAQVAAACHGDFLVRQSRQSSDYVLVVNDNGRPVNFQIRQLDTGYLFADSIFLNIRDLISHLQTSPLQGPSGGVLHLGRPAATGNDTVVTTRDDPMNASRASLV